MQRIDQAIARAGGDYEDETELRFARRAEAEISKTRTEGKSLPCLYDLWLMVSFGCSSYLQNTVATRGAQG